LSDGADGDSPSDHAIDYRRDAAIGPRPTLAMDQVFLMPWKVRE
jgi:hypothetical protein